MKGMPDAQANSPSHPPSWPDSQLLFAAGTAKHVKCKETDTKKPCSMVFTEYIYIYDTASVNSAWYLGFPSACQSDSWECF